MRRARHKYGAKPTVHNGRRYASKAEARYAVHLGRLQAAGEVVGWLEQVPLHFRSGNKYVADFLVFSADGGCELVDVKGVETPAFKIKRRLIADEYPWIDFRVVPTKEVPG